MNTTTIGKRLARRGSAHARSYDRNESLYSGIFWIILALSVLNGTVMECSGLQGTLGKIILGIKVTKENGGRLSFANALGRSIIKIASVVFFGIGCLIAAFTEKRQALHDLPANCIVVRRKAVQTVPGGTVGQNMPQPEFQLQTPQAEPPQPASDGQDVVGTWGFERAVITNISEQELSEITAEFHHTLMSRLFSAGLPMNRQSVNQIFIVGHFVCVDGGKRAARYFSNGMAGKAKLEAEGEIIINSTRFAYLHGKKDLGLAFQVFGGDNAKMLKLCVAHCANEIAEQAIRALVSLRRENPA